MYWNLATAIKKGAYPYRFIFVLDKILTRNTFEGKLIRYDPNSPYKMNYVAVSESLNDKKQP